jgi:hypothetical protein
MNQEVKRIAYVGADCLVGQLDSGGNHGVRRIPAAVFVRERDADMPCYSAGAHPANQDIELGFGFFLPFCRSTKTASACCIETPRPFYMEGNLLPYGTTFIQPKGLSHATNSGKLHHSALLSTGRPARDV